MSQNFIEQSIEIIRATHDGDDLAPPDLKLVELAVNGWLNEAGEVAFAELLANVRRGYKPPWFMGIEHMTRDHQRYVYWKGQRVEHYDHDFWQQDGLAGAYEARCRRIGKPVPLARGARQRSQYDECRVALGRPAGVGVSVIGSCSGPSIPSGLNKNGRSRPKQNHLD
jgi:hypothetical protein